MTLWKNLLVNPYAFPTRVAKTAINCFTQESLRLYPPAPSTARQVLRDNYDIAGYHIPKGSDVLVCVVASFISFKCKLNKIIEFI